MQSILHQHSQVLAKLHKFIAKDLETTDCQNSSVPAVDSSISPPSADDFVVLEDSIPMLNDKTT
jgi:hypothetical protein